MAKLKKLFFKDAFDEKRDVSRKDIQKLVKYLNTVGDEGLLLEVKDFDKIRDNVGNISFDKIRKGIGKHISAMANSSGGLIVIGINEDSNREDSFELRPADLTSVNLQYLQRTISSSVEPVANFEIELVEVDREGEKIEGVILIFIEQSPNPPHQVVHSRRYYFRHGESSSPASHSLVTALFGYRKRPLLEILLIKTGKKEQRFIIKNKGISPAFHTHLIFNIYPRPKLNGKIVLNQRIIQSTTDGLWNIKAFLGSNEKNFMKFRFRARPGQIILPKVNEVLFDLPIGPYPETKVTAEIFCEGFHGHQDFCLFT